MISRLFFLTIATSLLFGCAASRIYKPKKMIVAGDFVHSRTGTVFPESFERFKRGNITSFNKDCSNIGVSYFFDDTRKDPSFTIYIYPAPPAIEHRIREEYFYCLQSIANVANKGINANQTPIRLSKNGYKLLGLSAAISEENLKTVLTIFECGEYFMKYRISSNNIDTGVLINISNKLTDRFSPIDIVKKYPLIDSSSIHISPAITADKACLNAMLAGVFAKIKWTRENVDSLERCSGFPSLYFEEQKVTIDSMLNKWKIIKHNNTVHDKFFNDLLLIRNSGYLNEFIYDQFGGILLLPDKLTLDFDNYEKWKARNKPTVKLTGQYYYLIGFEKSYKNEKEN